MNRVWLKAASIALIAVVATETISFMVRFFVGMPADHITIALGAIIPIVIAMPIGVFVFRQTAKLDQAYAALVVANERLAQKASHDHMTGLLNRESFLAQFDVARLSPAGGTLLIIDADHFKKINDSFGHLVGDQALLKISDAISSSVRRGDFVGRIGGEEFGAFLIGADWNEASRIAQRLRGEVENVVLRASSGEIVPLTVSIGGTIAKTDVTVGQLMGEADSCLYQAKRSGRNRVIIESVLTVAA